MDETRNNQHDSSGVHQNYIATQLAAIITKLDSFESLKADVAFLKAQRLKSDYGPRCHKPKKPVADQLAAIAARLAVLESHLKEEVASLKSHYGPPPNQIKKEKTVDSPNDDADRFKLDTEEVSGNNHSDDEDRFEHVVGGQLEVGDGIQLKIEDVEQTQDHVKGMPTNLPSTGRAHLISWADEKEKWVEPSGWKDSYRLKIGKGGHVYSYRVWASPLADKKFVVYWSDIYLNATISVKARNVRKHINRRLVKGQISTTIEWLIAWSTNSFLSDLRTNPFSGPDVLIRTHYGFALVKRRRQDIR